MTAAAERGDGAVPSGVPWLAFAVEGADVLPFAATPTLRFALRVRCDDDVPIHAAALAVQLRIAVAERAYDEATRARLVEVLGDASQQGKAARTVFWTQAATLVPAFRASVRVDLPVACTYDFELVAAKLFHCVEEGVLPLDLVFTGTVFYEDAAGSVRAARIPHDAVARYRLPIGVWKEAVDRCFPGSAWLRLGRDTFDRLYAWRCRRLALTWDETLDALLAGAGDSAAAAPTGAGD